MKAANTFSMLNAKKALKILGMTGALLLILSGCELVPNGGGGAPTSAERAAVSSSGPKMSDAQFQTEVINSSVPVLVEFWMVGCMYCATYSTTLDDFSVVYGSRVKVVRIDIGTNPDLRSRYDIWGLPTTIFFKNGQAVEEMMGSVPLSELEQTANALLR